MSIMKLILSLLVRLLRFLYLFSGGENMKEKHYKILAINPGSTSTKIALYEDETELFSVSISHSVEDLSKFERIMDQKNYRTGLIKEELKRKGVEVSSLSAVVGRGGLLKPLESGTYEVNEAMIKDLERAERGEHASNLGAVIAKEIADLARG